eukprot:2828194-Amphidinium_carterae.1
MGSPSYSLKDLFGFDLADVISLSSRGASQIVTAIFNNLVLGTLGAFLNGSELGVIMMIVVMSVKTILAFTATSQATSNITSLVDSNRRSVVVLRWMYHVPLGCVISALLTLSSLPEDDGIFSETLAVAGYLIGHCLNYKCGGVAAVRGLLYRTPKASASRTLTTVQSVAMYYQVIATCVVGFVRMSVAELSKAIMAAPSSRATLIATSNFGIFLNRPFEASFGLGMMLIVLAVVMDLGQSYGMSMSIVSQASRGSSIIVGAALDDAADALAELVTYQTQTLWTVRNRLLASDLSTPALAKLVWICHRSAAATSKRERDSLQSEQNH